MAVLLMLMLTLNELFYKPAFEKLNSNIPVFRKNNGNNKIIKFDINNNSIKLPKKSRKLFKS